MTEPVNELFASELVVINVGPTIFADALSKQGLTVLQVDWKPLAAGDSEMAEILAELGGI